VRVSECHLIEIRDLKVIHCSNQCFQGEQNRFDIQMRVLIRRSESTDSEMMISMPKLSFVSQQNVKLLTVFTLIISFNKDRS